MHLRPPLQPGSRRGCRRHRDMRSPGRSGIGPARRGSMPSKRRCGLQRATNIRLASRPAWPACAPGAARACKPAGVAVSRPDPGRRGPAVHAARRQWARSRKPCWHACGASPAPIGRALTARRARSGSLHHRRTVDGLQTLTTACIDGPAEPDVVVVLTINSSRQLAAKPGLELQLDSRRFRSMRRHRRVRPRPRARVTAAVNCTA
jgi:hypothetical protein